MRKDLYKLKTEERRARHQTIRIYVKRRTDRKKCTHFENDLGRPFRKAFHGEMKDVDGFARAKGSAMVDHAARTDQACCKRWCGQLGPKRTH